MTNKNIEALSRRAQRAFREAVHFAKIEHANEKRPFYVLKEGKVVDYFRVPRRLIRRKAS